MKLLKKIVKVSLVVVFLLLISVYFLFISFSSPKSSLKILEEYKDKNIKIEILDNRYKTFKFRSLSFQKEIDSSKLNMVFIHGAIGSSTDFNNYLQDSLIRIKFNMFSYDRIGYNHDEKMLAQQSIEFEKDLLEHYIKKLDSKKTVLVGYSYGGPIALASKKKYKKIVLLAPAVYSKVEPMPFMLNFYKWKLTRWLVPHVWKSASLEKLNHKEELRKFENNWNDGLSNVISIHGDMDGIVPLENSLFLEDQFSKDKFELKVIKNVGHSLVWSNFEFIKLELLKLAN